MDTARLRALRTFPKVHILLGELITNQKLIPADSLDLKDPDTFTGALKASLLKAEGNGYSWYAWSANREVYAIAGSIDEVSSRMHARPVLSVLFYDGKGRVIGSSKWLEVRPNFWAGCDFP
jgi:hypothetical protein